MRDKRLTKGDEAGTHGEGALAGRADEDLCTVQRGHDK